jgi:hypothetical protein
MPTRTGGSAGVWHFERAVEQYWKAALVIDASDVGKTMHVVERGFRAVLL